MYILSDEFKTSFGNQRSVEGLKKTMDTLSDRSEYLRHKSQKFFYETVCSFAKESHEVGVPYSQTFFRYGCAENVKSAAI